MTECQMSWTILIFIRYPLVKGIGLLKKSNSVSKMEEPMISSVPLETLLLDKVMLLTLYYN